MKAIRQFCQDETGQDLIEYSLLMAFLAIASMGFIASGRSAISGIWHTENTQLVTANTVAAGS